MQAIVITGTPGTGKSRLARLLKQKIKNAEIVNVNEFAIKHGLVIGEDEFGASIINTKKLSVLLNALVDKSRRTLILEGHLLCDMKIKNAKAVVLREHLATLKKRMEMRGYRKRKIYDNLVAEATDYCGIEASKRYKQVGEFLSSDPKLLEKVLQFIKYGKKEGDINLLGELLSLMKQERNFSL
ncbi:MAG: AAA family ATPase [Candidatus Micrarchaeia archaeon]|jgi:adenylate kinase